MRSAPAPDDVDRAAQKLVAAKSPVIVCGGGVVISGACAALATLASRLNAPVCTTVSGQGSLADTHPLNAGVVGSNGGVRATREVLSAADLVLFIGCRAGSTSTEHWRVPSSAVPILHIDSDPMVIAANYQTEVGMAGDALLALTMLNEAVESRLASRPADATDGRAIVARAQEAKWALFRPLAESLDRPIKPERVVDALNRLLPPMPLSSPIPVRRVRIFRPTSRPRNLAAISSPTAPMAHWVFRWLPAWARRSGGRTPRWYP